MSGTCCRNFCCPAGVIRDKFSLNQARACCACSLLSTASRACMSFMKCNSLLLVHRGDAQPQIADLLLDFLLRVNLLHGQASCETPAAWPAIPDCRQRPCDDAGG